MPKSRKSTESSAKPNVATRTSTRSKGRVSSKYFQNNDDSALDDAARENTETGSKRKRKSKAPTASNKIPKVEEPERQPNPSQYQTLLYLLSPSALQLCRPKDESKELAEKGPSADYRTYSGSVLTPFEELLSAVILSRPISHALGHRSIRTILNPPYRFSNARAIRKAGPARVLKAMFDARTQHKDKTAVAIAKFADVVAEKFGGEDDTSLEEVRKQSDYDPNKERALLKSSIHGLGNTGLNIFYRRIQWLWTQSFPFMDERTEDAAASLGLPDDAEELYDMIDAIWEELDTDQFDGGDEEEKKRRAFVVLLERVIGAQLEKKVVQVLQEAEKMPE
ncbi:uncharacterized protein PV09_02212 [Verruconis gallopava]|uniref:Uncharacterized protein n=1 Tax=Verruconis gallopava TaxID=253628 RepID=A0A0D1XX43_9PEZI|nr:uncharacterized protein PV09_02212 [Verruconis gallopava]KIW07366.1 hypothetical protein PV09_02212 [Verruconis gallopava]